MAAFFFFFFLSRPRSTTLLTVFLKTLACALRTGVLCTTDLYVKLRIGIPLISQRAIQLRGYTAERYNQDASNVANSPPKKDMTITHNGKLHVDQTRTVTSSKPCAVASARNYLQKS
uniref:Uncharacterized protein n=1 Tax=Prorocentrum micans TaxID=2945 RepID=A0A7S2TAU0_PROMC|mmetsp:Transcript_13411/g.10732  ORF Transcript_13411/g.10732 Transcript_13411/m.10732 type:complete len:117 (+) Transcript_13411:3-353(+)